MAPIAVLKEAQAPPPGVRPGVTTRIDECRTKTFAANRDERPPAVNSVT
jgi:hypothetical protein